MPTQWIPAARALAIVTTSSNERAARLALCTRAHAGLVKTRARLLTMGSARDENGEIPAEFWWAEGHEALDQDWDIGDFSTLINEKIDSRAYGVTFDFDGLREMIPPVKAAVILRELSVAGDTEWLTALAARGFMYNELGLQPAVAGAALIDQGRLGFVAARAVAMQQAFRSEHVNNWSDVAREWDIPEWFWQRFTEKGSSSQDWERGIFAGQGSAPCGARYITLTGVHFARASLGALRPETFESDAVATTPTLGKAGRPTADFWDELWCAVWGQIYRAELLPKRQADVERAMLAWASERDFDLSPSAAKPRARKLFLEYEKEGKNS